MGKLYLIPTPVGNLEDITFRAVNLLKSCDLILAEDTRTSSYLLKHYGIETRMHSTISSTSIGQCQTLWSDYWAGADCTDL